MPGEVDVVLPGGDAVGARGGTALGQDLRVHPAGVKRGQVSQRRRCAVEQLSLLLRDLRERDSLRAADRLAGLGLRAGCGLELAIGITFGDLASASARMDAEDSVALAAG
ncbi:hypothetical protein [Janibacter melonis]|uniref:hypothetical protein n=1 Tax=Janibacter melonis TaxID=262209 RepID=UPI002094AC3B|nr:hypothetical protein [Janibacter melonis]